eukprot:TRINITY_DN13218_c0_g1_i3.p1 TRINITY_DN13218_c0_g1~~TRINITY_DN13218_c0_g1_i3.p1  ORF type:complete len:286 (+),score=43.67 TRINITY_DN13218_c0_g1_i3:88-945(+)
MSFVSFHQLQTSEELTAAIHELSQDESPGKLFSQSQLQNVLKGASREVEFYVDRFPRLRVILVVTPSTNSLHFYCTHLANEEENPQAFRNTCIVSVFQFARTRFGDQPFDLESVLESYRSILEQTASRHGWTSEKNLCFLYTLPQQLWGSEEFKVDNDVKVESIRLSDADYVISFWPYAHEMTVDTFRQILQILPSFAIYIDEKPVCWMAVLDYGSLSMLHTLEEYRGRGYAERVVRAACSTLPAAGMLPFCYTLQENVKSNNLFRKVGFEVVEHVSWMHLTKTS